MPEATVPPQDERTCAYLARVRLDAYALVRVPTHHRDIASDRCSGARRQREVRLDTLLRKEQPRTRLVERHRSLRHTKAGKARMHLGRLENLVGEPVLDRASQRAGEELTPRRPDHQAAGLHEQLLADLLLERRPQLVRALHDRHVARMLVVRLANDACAAVRRSVNVRSHEAVDAEHRTPRDARW